MSGQKNSTRFIAENVRVTRINRLEKVAFITVFGFSGRGTTYIDITDFDGAKNDSGIPIGEGESVTVTGDVSMRKPQGGGGKWTIQLVARRWIAGKEDMTAPMPAPRNTAPQDVVATPDDDNVPF